ncbi:MAG: hypothetical protein H6774_03035 [Pseudomonadales bacterium]|nr:hypothetical protein [Pseudomonadales bacterium]
MSSLNIYNFGRITKSWLFFKLLPIFKLFNITPKEIKTAEIIEYSLESFGIKSRVEAITFEKKSNLFSLSIPHGIKVEEIEKLSKNIALSVASKTGEVKIIAPIPGKPYIGIEVPK